MPKAIFINFAVRDLPAAIDFWTKLGFRFNAQFSDDQAAALVLSDAIYAMIHTHESLRRFTSKAIADPRTTTEALFSLRLDSKQEVDGFMAKAIAAGGRAARPLEDFGFMYARSFEDPDGHIWEIFWMDPAHVLPGEPAKS
jgi:uncharacterized protein